jgi:hypothetical protein
MSHDSLSFRLTFTKLFWNKLHLIYSYFGNFWGVKCEGEVHSRTGHEGPEGEYKYSSTLSLTSALDGVYGQRHAPAAFPSGKKSDAHCIRGWVAPGPVWKVLKISPHQDSIPRPSTRSES